MGGTNPNYNYVQADWVDGGDVEGRYGSTNVYEDYDGWGLEGELALTPTYFLHGAYSDVGKAFGDDTTLASVGFGLKGPVYPNYGNMDVYGLVTYEDLESDVGDTDGYGLTLGVRWLPGTPDLDLEIHPSVGYVSYGEVENSDADVDGWRFGIRAIYPITSMIGVSAEWRAHRLENQPPGREFNLDLDEFRLGVRVSFDPDATFP